MTISTIRPNAVVYVSNWVNEAGGAVTSTKVSDDSDATYVRATAGYPFGIGRVNFGMGTLSPSATQRILRMRVLARCAHEGSCVGWFEQTSATLKDPTSKALISSPRDFFKAKNPTVPKLYTGTWRNVNPDGKEWTKKMVDSIEAEFYGYKCANNSSNFLRVYEVYIDVDIHDQIMVTGAPSITGNTTTSRPTVDWLNNLVLNADGDQQIAYQVRFYESSVFSAPGFDLNNTAAFPPASDSGQVASQATSVQSTADLQNLKTYRAYIRVASDFNGARWFSNWANSNSFVMGYEPLPRPFLTVTPDNVQPHIRNMLIADSKLNLFGADDASFDGGLGGWAVVTGCTIAVTGTPVLKGPQSMRITATGTGDMVVSLPGGGFGYRVDPNKAYLFLESFRADPTGRTCRLEINWFDGNGAQIGGSVIGPNITDITTGWTQASLYAISPANAQFVQVIIRVVGPVVNGERHFADAGGIFPLTLGNLLLTNQASVESATDPTGLEAKVNCSGARSTAVAGADGAAEWQMTATAGGQMKSGTADAYRIPVSPDMIGDVVTGRLAARAATTGRPCRAELLFWNALSGGATISTITGNFVNDVVGSWTEPIFVTTTIPAGTQGMELRMTVGDGVTNPGAAEVHYTDKHEIWIGDSALWSPGLSWFAGGMAGLDSVLIEFTEWSTASSRVVNLLNPQLASGGGLVNAADGLFKRFANDQTTIDKSQIDLPITGETAFAWIVGQSAFSGLDIGAPNGVYEPTYTFPCVPGLQMCWSMFTKAATGSHSMKMFLIPIDQTGAQVGIGTEFNSGTITVDTTWRRYFVTGAAPPGSVGWRGFLENSNGDLTTFLMVGMQLEFGATPSSPWYQGQGQGPAWKPVRNAKTALMTGITNNLGVVYDREAPPACVRMYRCTSIVTLSDGTILASDPSYYIQTRLNLLGQGHWIIKDPNQPAHDVLVNVTNIPESITEDQDVFHPIRPNAVNLFGQRPTVNSLWVGGDDGTLTFIVTTEREWYILKQLLRLKGSLLLQFPEGGQRYIRFQNRNWDRVGYITSCDPDQVYRRIINTPFIESDRPPVLQ